MVPRIEAIESPPANGITMFVRYRCSALSAPASTSIAGSSSGKSSLVGMPGRQICGASVHANDPETDVAGISQLSRMSIVSVA